MTEKNAKPFSLLLLLSPSSGMEPVLSPFSSLSEVPRPPLSLSLSTFIRFFALEAMNIITTKPAGLFPLLLSNHHHDLITALLKKKKKKN